MLWRSVVGTALPILFGVSTEQGHDAAAEPARDAAAAGDAAAGDATAERTASDGSCPQANAATRALAERIAERLEREADALRDSFASAEPVQHVVVAGLLGNEIAAECAAGFPARADMKRLQSIREHKSTCAKPESWGATCRAVMDAFQQGCVLEQVAKISGIEKLRADDSYWASGLSRMDRDDFLNPHIDNSGHGSFRGYRRLNLLYYVSPAWDEDCGGNLELWAPKLRDRLAIPARCDTLAIMATNRRSWHSVDRIRVDRPRLCLSNYYYTLESPDAHGREYSHITSFRGRPGQPLRDLVLRAEGVLGSAWVRLAHATPTGVDARQARRGAPHRGALCSRRGSLRHRARPSHRARLPRAFDAVWLRRELRGWPRHDPWRVAVSFSCVERTKSVVTGA